MSRQPKVVQRPSGRWDVTTSVKGVEGHYYLTKSGWCGPWEDKVGCVILGSFPNRRYAVDKLDRFGPPPFDAVWDDDCVDVEAEDAAALAHQEAAIGPIVALHQETLAALAKVADELSKVVHSSPTPAPAMEWKPIVETLDELRGMSPVRCVLAYFPHTKNTAVVKARAAVECHTHDAWGGAAWMLLPAPPKPTPTLAELERAVVEAVDAMKRHGVYAKGSFEDVLITRHDALLAARENAAKGGGE